MIEETPPLAFAPAFERPPAALAERLRGVPTSFVVDAMGGAGALDWRIKPIVDLPIFAMGVSPNSPSKRGPGAVGLPIVCGGATIAPGDVIVGDRDGVVVVPRARLPATLDRLKAAEAAMLERVRGGLRELPLGAAARRRDRGA
jgi:hypothetical protein